MKKHAEKAKMKKLLLTTAAAVLVTTAGTCAIYMAAESAAGDSVKVSAIDYDKLTLTVQANSDDNRVYFATSKTATTWEKIPGDLSNNKITMDISWVSISKNTTLYLKGDKSEQPCEVVLPKQNTTFKATFSPEDNTMKFVNKGDATDVYWRKSTATTWTKYDENNEPTELFESFCTKGITLYFRTGQVAGTSSSTGMRPSKTCTVKIAKRAAAPKITLDYSKLAFTGVKTTMEYKPSTGSAWTAIDSTTLNLKDALPEAIQSSRTSNSNDPETVSIDFRIKATVAKVASQTCTIEVPVQTGTPDNVALSYTGSKQCKLTAEAKGEGDTAIAAASAANPYEYAIIKDGSEFDVSTAKWVTMKTAAVTLSSTTAPEGSTIYVRKKATKTALATAATPYKVSAYPSANLNTLTKNVELEKIQGQELAKETFSITALGTDTTVASILCSGTPIEFTATSEPVNGKDASTISITITNVAKAENIGSNLEKENDIRIILSNGDDICEGVTLYIKKAATIEAAAYTKYIGMPFTSTVNANGDICFDVALNSTKKAGVTIDTITYNGNTLQTNQTSPAVNDYTVGTITNNTIPVTIHNATINKLEKDYLKISNYGTAFSFVVTLSNGETLEQVTAKVAYPVTVSADTSSVGISQSGYKTALEQADKNNTTLTGAYADPVISYTLDSEAAKGNSYEIESLTWYDSVTATAVDVLGSYTKNGSTWQVTLSLAKLMKCNPGSAELTLTLTNKDKPGETLTVDYGYYITLIQ